MAKEGTNFDDEIIRKKFKLFLSRKKVNDLREENKRLSEQLKLKSTEDDVMLRNANQRISDVLHLHIEKQTIEEELQCFSGIQAVLQSKELT